MLSFGITGDISTLCNNTCVYIVNGRRGGLTVSALDSESNGPGSSPVWTDKVKSVYEPRGPSGRSLSRFP